MADELNQKNIPARKTNLLKYYRFDNLIAGENNNFALAFAKAVAESPGKEYNPLFIYSNVGLGKTHLLNAVGNAIIEKMPGKKVYYISSQQFEAELVEAIQFNKIEDFRTRYTDLDVLLLDDVQFIAFKESAQQEFFHAFNELFNKGKQIVLSSDRPPGTLSTLEQRLRSRFEGGIITEMGQPDLETRKAILNKKLEEKGIILPEEVIDILCNNIKEDIRKLEGALKELIAFSKLAQKTIDSELAFKVLRQKMQSAPKPIDYGQQGHSNAVFPRNEVIVRLESPNDSVMNVPATKNPLKININLPPKPAKKESLIKMETKNIKIEPAQEIANHEEFKAVFEDNNTTRVTPAVQRDAEGNPIGIVGQPGDMTEAHTSNAGNIHYESIKLSSAKPSGGNAQEYGINQNKQIPPPKEEDSYQKYIKDIQKNLDENSISVTSVFASQSLQNKLNQASHLPQRAVTSQPAQPAQPTSVKPADSAREPDNPAIDTPNPEPKASLTNIFSSKDVKEKINQIIAVGNSDTGKDDDMLGAGATHQSSASRNAFEKEHKKKLQYELKHFDDMLKKINKGKINIYYFDAIDDFTKNLEYAHIANREGRYQTGLDHIRKVKKAFAELTLEKDDAGLKLSKSSFVSQNVLIGAGLAVVFLLIGLILYFLFFGGF